MVRYVDIGRIGGHHCSKLYLVLLILVALLTITVQILFCFVDIGVNPCAPEGLALPGQLFCLRHIYYRIVSKILPVS